MFLSTVEFVCGLLIGLVVGHLLHYKTYIQLCNINQKLEIAIQAVELIKIKIKSKSSKLPSERKYADDVENLWKDFKKFFDTKSELDPDFSFTKVATQIRELRGGKGIANSTLNNFYQRKTNPRKITVEAVQEWVDKEKEKGEEDVVALIILCSIVSLARPKYRDTHQMALGPSISSHAIALVNL